MANLVSERYATALYDMAQEAQVHAEVYDQLCAIDKLFAANPDYSKLLISPAVIFFEKKAAIEQAFAGKVHVYVLNFLYLLTEKQRIAALPEIVQAYQDLHYAAQGICEVKVTTAVTIDPAQAQALTEKLSKLLQKQVILKNKVEGSIMGGVKIDVDNRQIDSTIRTRLAELGRQIHATIA